MTGAVHRSSALALASAALIAGCVDRFDVGAFQLSSGDGGEGGNGGAGGAGAGGTPSDVVIEPFTTPLAVAFSSSCALRSTGGVACWGGNEYGELGHGQEPVSQSATPVTPVGFASGATAVFGGGAAHCALRDTGRIDCWGAALIGEFMGMALPAYLYSPLEVPGLGDDIAQVTLGFQWGCALTRSGGAKCWGFGGTGQLGNGTTDDAYVPADVVNVGGERYVHLSASARGFHTCGVTVDGGVRCWGENDFGQLGVPGANQSVPVAVEGLEPAVVEVAAGRDHTCARSEDARVFCWGSNAGLQLGSAGASGGPREVPNVAARAISAGGDQSCALATDDAVICWGQSAFDAPSLPSVEVEASFGAVAVATSGLHACAANAAHVVRCWGYDDVGQLGGGELAL